MSIDRGLEYELLRDPHAESALFDRLETERTLERAKFEKCQSHLIDLGTQRGADIYYQSRDEAFFNNLNLLRQLKSPVTFVTNFQQPIPMPKIQRGDAHIISELEKHNPKQTAYLATIEEFILDKKAHESTVERLNRWIIDVNDEMRALVLPQILYFLLVYMQPLFFLYRWFKPANELDTALHQSQKLINHLEELETELHEEDAKFYKKWGAKYSEYLLVANSQKLSDLRDNEAKYSQLLEQNNIVITLIRQSEQPDLQESYQQFVANPSYINLFQLCTKLCIYRFDLEFKKDERKVLVDQAINALGKLYPEVQNELKTFAFETQNHLSVGVMFDILTNQYEHPIQKAIELRQKIDKANIAIIEITRQSSQLHPDSDKRKIFENRTKIEKYYGYISKAEQEIQRLNTMIQSLKPLKDFLENRSGENLQKLYQFSLDPENHLPITDMLRNLYPSALRELKEENERIILSDSRALYPLLEKYLVPLKRIEDSREAKIAPYKEMARALHQLLITSDWTWKHFAHLEKVVQNNPQYFRHPVLAALFTDVTRMVANSRLFPAVVEKTISRPTTAAPELIINQPNLKSTFFQPPTRVSAPANAIIKEILRNMNAFRIQFSDETPSDEKKQEYIDAIGNKMLNYIDLLSSDSSGQTISADHLALLQELKRAIAQMCQQVSRDSLNETQFIRIHELLEQLAAEHPVRKGITFLIDLYRNKTNYMMISTQFAQEQLRKDIHHELIELEKMMAKHHKGHRHTVLAPEIQLNLDRWSTATSLLKIMKHYTQLLEENASASNAEECTKIKRLTTDIDAISSILRYYHRNSYSTVPGLLEQVEQDLSELGEHALCLAAVNAIEALKATTEYAQISAPGPKQKGKA